MSHRRVTPKLASLAVLLLATLVMYVSQGLTHTLIPLRLASGSASGFVTACYFLGFGLGAFLGPLLIRRVGHIRAFGGLLVIVIFAVLSLALIDALWFWAIIRLLHGASIAAVAVVVEAWLVSASGPIQRRGNRPGPGSGTGTVLAHRCASDTHPCPRQLASHHKCLASQSGNGHCGRLFGRRPYRPGADLRALAGS